MTNDTGPSGSISQLLHLVPGHALANKLSGAFKDVWSRIEWLKQNFADYRLIPIHDDDPSLLDGVFGASEAPSDVLVEYSSFPRIVESIRKRAPFSRISVRCHNIEPLQYLDNEGWFPKTGNSRLIYGMARLAWQDWRTKSRADRLLCINDWEISSYWRRLPGRATMAWLPYRCPDYLIPAAPLPYADRRLIACLPTSQKNRKSVDLVSRFLNLAATMRREGSEMEFVLTGDLDHWGMDRSSAVSYVGIVEDLADLLGQCAAVCVLSPLGHGYKTTIGDALAAGAHAVVHPKLHARCPSAIRGHLLQADTAAPKSIKRLMDELKVAPGTADLGASIESRFQEVMAETFRV